MSPVAIVKPIQLVVHCIAEKKGDQWQTFSLEFGLAAQGETLAEVKQKLHGMLLSYLTDALVGEDQEHAAALLARRATWNVYAKYYLLCALSYVTTFKERMLFSSPWPLRPEPCV